MSYNNNNNYNYRNYGKFKSGKFKNYRNNDTYKDEEVKNSINTISKDKEANTDKNEIYLLNGKLYIKGTKKKAEEFDLANDEDIGKLADYCSEKHDNIFINSVNKGLDQYFQQKLKTYNIIRNNINKELPEASFLFNEYTDEFEKVRHFNNFLKIIGEKYSIDVNNKGQTLELLIKNQQEIQKEKEKSKEKQRTKLSELKEDSMDIKSKFEKFFEILRNSTSKSKKDFFRMAGLLNDNDSKSIDDKIFEEKKQEFYKKFTVENGTIAIKSFFDTNEDYLLKTDEAYDVTHGKLEEYSETLRNNNKDIKQLLSQNTESINSSTGQAEKLFSMVNKSFELYKKRHPLKGWFLEVFGMLDDRSEQIQNALDTALNSLYTNITNTQNKINTVKDENLNEQIASIDSKIKNRKSQMSEYGISLDTNIINNDTTEEKLKSEKKNNKIRKGFMEISGVKQVNDSRNPMTSLDDKYVFKNFGRKSGQKFINEVNSLDGFGF